jgi:hypothetical protein
MLGIAGETGSMEWQCQVLQVRLEAWSGSYRRTQETALINIAAQRCRRRPHREEHAIKIIIMQKLF